MSTAGSASPFRTSCTEPAAEPAGENVSVPSRWWPPGPVPVRSELASRGHPPTDERRPGGPGPAVWCACPASAAARHRWHRSVPASPPPLPRPPRPTAPMPPARTSACPSAQPDTTSSPAATAARIRCRTAGAPAVRAVLASSRSMCTVKVTAIARAHGAPFRHRSWAAWTHQTQGRWTRMPRPRSRRPPARKGGAAGCGAAPHCVQERARAGVVGSSTDPARTMPALGSH